MANQSSKDCFTGRSGQLAVMAEFLVRQVNVAIPEVDVGDDILIVRDDQDEITRVQVKTAHAVEREQDDKFAAKFSIPMRQLEGGPKHLVYAFVVRRQNRWEEFVIVRRSILYELHTDHGILGGKSSKQTLILTFTRDNVVHRNLSFQSFRNRFTPWPPMHILPLDVFTSEETPRIK